MILSDELIQKFFAGQSSSEEAAFVSKALAEDPALMEKYLSYNDWEAAQSEPGPPIRSGDEMWRVVNRHHQERQPRSGLLLLRIAVAASVVITAGLAWLMISGHGSHKATDGNAPIAVTKPADTSMAFQQNTGKALKEVHLPDGSMIRLYPQSTVRYLASFNRVKREIFLEGEAYFSVSKNKERPFTVYSANISTTALGTSFTITSFPENNRVKVELHTGKVVIRKESGNGAMKDVFLLPGEQVVINQRDFKIIPDAQDALKPERAQLSLPDNGEDYLVEDTASLIEVKGEPLKQLFARMIKIYHIDIKADQKEISNLEFTGTINRTEPPEKILENIALLNGFTLTKTASGFLFQKIK